MGDLSNMSDSAKVAFLLEALDDAAYVLRINGFGVQSARYEGYVREIRGAQQKQEASHG